MDGSQQLDFVLNKLTEEVILDFFIQHGAVEASRDDRHVWFNTFCHGGDSNKLCYNRDSKSFYCYTRCGFLSVFTLAQRVLDVPFWRAVETLAALAGADRRHRFNTQDWFTRSYIQDLERYASANTYTMPEVPFDFPAVPESVLKYYDANTLYEGWLEEGIAPDVMVQFGIAWDEPGKAVIIPHRDIRGKLVGIRKRPIAAVANKYTPVVLEDKMYAHPLGMNLYGLYEHRKAITGTRQAILFEGEKSVLKHASMYPRSNAVAVCGSHVSDMQRALLLHLGVEEVILAFDRDYDTSGEGGGLYRKKIEAIGRIFTPFMRTYAILDMRMRTGLKEAPVDQGQAVFEQLMREKIALIT